MCAYQLQIADGLHDFVDDLQEKEVSYRFAVVRFGGAPTILQSFSNDADSTKAAIKSVGCDQIGQEAGLEALRMTALNMTDLSAGCAYGTPCEISWRPDARRMIIMVTDEDSDLPTNPYAPSFFYIT